MNSPMQRSRGFVLFTLSLQPLVFGALSADALEPPIGGHTEKLVTGDAEHLSNVVAGYGATLKFYFTPRPPLPGTHPSLPYPAGWTITGQTLTVSNGGFTSAWITQIEGWDTTGPSDVLLRAFQDKIDATGFMGANAVPPNPGCDLVYPATTAFPCQKTCVGGANNGNPCSSGAQCSGGMPGGTCQDPCPTIMGEPGTKCGTTVAGVCDWGWENVCSIPDGTCNPPHRADWVLASIPQMDQTPAASIISPTGPIFASTASLYNEIFDEGLRYYTGTLVLPVPPCCKGMYTMDHLLGAPGAHETFAYDQAQPLSEIPVAAVIGGQLECQLGSCCTNFTSTSSATCTAGLAPPECDALGGSDLHIFRPNSDCTTPCTVECLIDADCDDGVFCNGEEICTAGSCGPGEPPCTSVEYCSEFVNECLPAPIPTVSQWGLVVLALLLAIRAKIGFRTGYSIA